MNTPVDRILYLQRTAGNQAVSRLMKSRALQAKLRIGQPGDVYEQEADRVADAVMRMPEPGVQREVEPEEEEEETLQTKPLGNQITPLVQVQRQEEPEEEEEILQAKSLAQEITPLVQRQVDPEEEEEELQAKATSGHLSEVNSNLESQIQSLKGGGQPLSENDRAFFEPRFGHDFSHVRVHTESSAADTAKSINARAFTLGNHVAMDSGEYHPNSRSGQRLLGHELTHVIQQGSRELTPGLQLTPAAYEPHFQTWTSKAEIKPRQLATIRFRTRNASRAPRGTKLRWFHLTIDRCLSVVRSRRLGRSGADIEIQVRGARVGKGKVVGDLECLVPGQPPLYSSVSITITVATGLSKARDRLVALRERRRRGRKVRPKKTFAAELRAIAEASKVLAKHSPASSSLASATMSRIIAQIGVLESARSRGYLKALAALNAKGLDSSPNYRAFGIALAGNLVWALSGIIPAAPGVFLGIKALRAFFAAAAAKQAIATAAVGTVGAMTSQFAGGLPKGTSTSAAKSMAVAAMTRMNSRLCNYMRREAYILFADAMTTAPLQRGTKASDYMAAVELGLRYALYGDVFKNGLNNGGLVSASKVQIHAHNQLLHQFVAAHGAVKGGKVVPTMSAESSLKTNGGNLVNDAISLLGGQQKLKFAPYELVINQMQSAAADMGCTIKIDPKKEALKLAQGYDLSTPVTSFNPSVVFAGQPNRWMKSLYMKKIVDTNPRIPHQQYIGLPNKPRISRVMVAKSDLSKTRLNGRTVYSAKRIEFTAHGVRSPRRVLIKVNVPAKFTIRYQIVKPPPALLHPVVTLPPLH
jgi:hypothetical protein